MHPADRRQFRQGFWATTLGTLVSRVLGMLRDATTANLLGLAAGGVMDAFVLAFRIANLSPPLLGEGALATSYLPVMAAELDRDREAALGLAATVLTRLAGVLTLLVLAGEAICGLLWIHCGPGDARLLFGLFAALLPYLWFICLAAQLSATLQALGKFRLPALAATLLNLGWLAGNGGWRRSWLKPPRAGPTLWPARSSPPEPFRPSCNSPRWAGLVSVAGRVVRRRQSAGCTALSGRNERKTAAWHGRSHPTDGSDRAGTLAPNAFSTLVDSSLAWLLTRPVDGPGPLPGFRATWFIRYRLAPGGAYYAERFYQLPVGLLGVAAATVIFPQLSRHAARGDRTALAGDLTSGLRLVVCLSLPAAVGLVLLAEPLARFVLEHGAFNAVDIARTAATTRAYALGVAAYCALPLLLRGFYAVGDARARFGPPPRRWQSIRSSIWYWPGPWANRGWRWPRPFHRWCNCCCSPRASHARTPRSPGGAGHRDAQSGRRHRGFGHGGRARLARHAGRGTGGGCMAARRGDDRWRPGIFRRAVGTR